MRFHWSLSQAGDEYRRSQATRTMAGIPSFEAQLELCRLAEELGIESMLMAIGFTRPDPLLLSLALGQRTERIKFMVACRAGLVTPTLFVQQINSLASIIGDRVLLNLVAGHTPKELKYYGDFLAHDERYARSGEFLSVCSAFWNPGKNAVDFDGKYYKIVNGKLGTPYASERPMGPEIYVGGNSEQAADLAVHHASCLWCFPDAPEKLASRVDAVTSRGVEVGLLVALIVRSTREEALEHAQQLISGFGEDAQVHNRQFIKQSDSVAFRRTSALARSTTWVTDCLWTGAVPYLGAPAICLVGSAAEVADAILEYKSIGISQFLFLGWPDREEIRHFGDQLLPLVREREAGEASSVSAARPRCN